jgi:polyisoprenoid-binding protein YceI
MPIMPGTHKLGPENGSLRIETKRRGAAAKAGHDLVIEVSSWQGTLKVGEDPSQITLTLSADSGSMEVIEGTGGIMPLTDEDKVEIKSTLEDEVLQPGQVEFKSTQVTPTDGGQRIEVTGELTLNGNVHPLDFDLELRPDGVVSGRATVKQSDWGIKPYSGLFGTLRVRDEVEVVGEASLPPRSREG